VPLSYLATLSQQIETPSALSFEEQSRLVVELKRGLRDPATFQDSRDLLGRLRARRDLLATIAEEIDEVVVRVPKRPGKILTAPIRGVAGSPVFGKRLPLSAVFSLRGIAGIVWPGPQAQLSSAILAEDAKIRRISRQKIWLHWLLWILPLILLHFAWFFRLLEFYNLLTVVYRPIVIIGIMGYVLTRSSMPVFGATGLCILFLTISNLLVYSWVMRFNVYYLGCAIVGGAFSQWIIQSARIKLAASR
jgi:hypothetical protein